MLFPSVTVPTRNHTHLHQPVCLLCKHTRLSHHHLLSELTNGLFAHASVFSKGGFDNIACPSCASDTAHWFSPFSQIQLTVEFWSAPPFYRWAQETLRSPMPHELVPENELTWGRARSGNMWASWLCMSKLSGKGTLLPKSCQLTACESVINCLSPSHHSWPTGGWEN